MAGSAPASRPPSGAGVRFSRAAALVALLLMAAGLVVAVVGQRLLAEEVRPSRQYVDGRYWTIEPGTCLGMGIETRAGCAAMDTAVAAGLEREHQDLVTVRALGFVLVGSGVLLLVLTFTSSRRAAQRLLGPQPEPSRGTGG